MTSAYTEVWLVQEADIKAVTPIDNNLDPDYINLFITPSQLLYVKPAFGEVFYDHLADAVQNSTLTDAENQLLERLKRPLCYFILYEALVHIRNRINQIGVVANTTDNSVAPEYSEFNSLRMEMRNKAEFLLNNEVLNFIKDNPTYFPLFGQTNSNSGTCNDGRTYRSGFAFY